MKKKIGYYVETPTEQIWCHNLACARETQKEVGGIIVKARKGDGK